MPKQQCLNTSILANPFRLTILHHSCHELQQKLQFEFSYCKPRLPGSGRHTLNLFVGEDGEFFDGLVIDVDSPESVRSIVREYEVCPGGFLGFVGLFIDLTGEEGGEGVY